MDSLYVTAYLNVEESVITSMNFLRNLSFPRCDSEQVLICTEFGTFHQVIQSAQAISSNKKKLFGRPSSHSSPNLFHNKYTQD